MALAIGSAAPDFELVNQHGEKISLSSFKGKKNVVVLFYPFAFSGICTGELCALRDDLSSFQNDSVELIAISCDPMYANKVFAEQEGYKFQVLSDFWPHGALPSHTESLKNLVVAPPVAHLSLAKMEI
jgi:mycoredoxin-dependent peroxiredoxin